MVGLRGYGSGYGITDGSGVLEGPQLDDRRQPAFASHITQRRQVYPQDISPVPIARPPPSPVPPKIPDIPSIPLGRASGGRIEDFKVPEVSGVRSGGSGEFQTPRENDMVTSKWGLSVDGYPVSPGGTVIRPPPLPPSRASQVQVPKVEPPILTLPSSGDQWLPLRAT